MKGYEGPLAHVPFPEGEQDQGRSGAGEQADDGGRAPPVLIGSPLQRKEEHDGGRGQQCKACKIEVRNDAAEQGERKGWLESLVWYVREVQEKAGYRADGEVDVEAWNFVSREVESARNC